jgi:PD-(D/E)XK endonuclease
LSISEETQQPEPSYATLHNKHRGELAELAFMRKAASRGYAVSKPWGDCERYDFVVRVGKAFWRVQVKSVRAKALRRPHYSVKTTNCHKLPYSPEDIDFLVAYIFPEDAWYVFPATVAENRKMLYINPNWKRSKLEKFREAWKLMEQTGQGQTREAQTREDQTCPPPETLGV